MSSFKLPRTDTPPRPPTTNPCMHMAGLHTSVHSCVACKCACVHMQVTGMPVRHTVCVVCGRVGMCVFTWYVHLRVQRVCVSERSLLAYAYLRVLCIAWMCAHGICVCHCVRVLGGVRPPALPVCILCVCNVPTYGFTWNVCASTCMFWRAMICVLTHTSYTYASNT